MAQTLTLTRKIKLLPTPDQERLLATTARAYTDACNDVARWCMAHESDKRDQIHAATYASLRGDHGLPSQMAGSAIRSVISAYKTIHATQDKWSIAPHFKKQNYALVWNRDYSLYKDTGSFSVNTLAGRAKIATDWRGHEDFYGREKYGTARLSYKHGNWYIFVPVTIEVPETPHDQIRDVVGIDLGINFLAVTYNSAGETTFYSGRVVKNTRAHYKQLRSELQAKQTRSSRRRLERIGSRENRWMNDVNHCITKALVNTTTPTLFVMEDLTGIRNATEKVHKKDRYVQVSWAFHDFRQKMEYKAALYGHQIIFVNPKYTSQRCPKCGHTERANRNKKAHLFRCRSCSYQSNDDRVGAMNLHDMGIQYRMQCAVSSAGGTGDSSISP